MPKRSISSAAITEISASCCGRGVVVDVGVDDEGLAARQDQPFMAAALPPGAFARSPARCSEVDGSDAPGAADHAVGVALVHQHGSRSAVQAAAHLILAVLDAVMPLRSASGGIPASSRF